MSRKVNVDLDVRATLHLRPGLTKDQIDVLHDQVAEGLAVFLPRVRKADIEDVNVTRLSISREAVEVGAAAESTPDLPDRLAMTATLDVLVRADTDADWGVIDRRIREGCALELPPDAPAGVRSCSVDAVRVTGVR